VEHVPRVQAEIALDHQAHRRAVQGQADVQLYQAARKVACFHLLDRVQCGELTWRGFGSGGHAHQFVRKWPGDR
jgi:hypothetical protein